MVLGGNTATVILDADPPRATAIRLAGSASAPTPRIAGGLLGVAGAEAWQGPRGGFDPHGLVTSAMFDLCRSYVDSSVRSPCQVAERHQSIPAPGWLLPIAIVHPDVRLLLTDTLELAIVAGVPRSALRACVTYVEIAAGLCAGRTADEAVLAATGAVLPPPSDSPPRLCGIAPVDALTAGLWALSQKGNLAELAPSLAYHTEPWVAAAAAGLLGLRDGCTAVPAQWFRTVPHADTCIDLAPGLLDTRNQRRDVGVKVA